MLSGLGSPATGGLHAVAIFGCEIGCRYFVEVVALMRSLAFGLTFSLWSKKRLAGISLATLG